MPHTELGELLFHSETNNRHRIRAYKKQNEKTESKHFIRLHTNTLNGWLVIPKETLNLVSQVRLGAYKVSVVLRKLSFNVKYYSQNKERAVRLFIRVVTFKGVVPHTFDAGAGADC